MLCCVAISVSMMTRRGRRGAGTRGGARGAGTVAARRGGRSASAASESSDGKSDGKQYCGSCSKEVFEGCIGCDRCETWVHGTEMCAGLPGKVIEAILEHDGQGIGYFCLKCRITRAAEMEKSPSQRKVDISSGTLTQIFQQMQGLCSAVAELTAQVKALSSSPQPSSQGSVAQRQSRDTSGTYAAALTHQPSTTTNPDQTPQTAEYRQIVRQELRELHEREKRKESVVIHGLKSTSTRGVSAEFGELTRRMLGTQVELTDIVPIAGHAGLYRGKILNENDRKLVLDRAKTLKGTEYDRVFIRKDLTYNQRCALKVRRDAYRSEQGQQIPLTASGEHPAPSSQESGIPRPPQGGTLTSVEDVPPSSAPASGAAGRRDGRTSSTEKPTVAAPPAPTPGPSTSSTGAPEANSSSNSEPAQLN